MGAIVLNGAVVGEESIIGAGALVSEGKEIPPRSLVLGVPGKIVRQVTDEELAGTLQNASSYVQLAREYAGE
jgi:carbonic anhydrase/acetyltransferase-like protein (isoleucine patch superfamily)